MKKLLTKMRAGFSLAESYRQPMPVVEIHLFQGGYAYPVCPRCKITLDREYQAYCDRCGQCLSWEDFDKAIVIFRL
ncbi:MAG: hypothetical protein HFG20_11520 [Anaerotruncus sp.]|nr:hypothetical protein [Anaerotruncus sp.]